MFLINPYIYATDAWSNLKSISFDGVDEIVNIGDIAILDSVANYSVSMWVKTSSLATLGVLIGKKTSTSSTNWNIHIQSDGSLGHSIQAAAAKTAASDITINTWHHIAATYNGGAAAANRVQLYVDGVSSLDSVTGTIPSSTLNNSHAQYIGGRNVGDSSIDFPFTGNIDEVGIFDYTLTSGEVTALYNSGCPNDLMTLAAAKRPEHYYRMGDGDTFSTLTDSGETGGNNGTMTNQESGDITTDVVC